MPTSPARQLRHRPVPFVGLDREHGAIAAELREAFDRVVTSSGFILGAEVEAFETEFAAYCGTEHCVGVASGTAALILGLQAAGIGRGDEVLVPAHTYVASVLGILHAGATPVFCDVDPATGLMDPESAEAAVSSRTRAMLPVHLYGQVCDMDRLGALAERHGLALFEDAAQAHGATWRGRRAGSFGRAAAFSFYPSKNLGALGDGGAICTDDAEVAARARELRNIGQRRKGQHVVAGYNERLDGLQAAFLRIKLRYLDQANAARRSNAAMLDAALPRQLERLGERPESRCVYHLYPVRTGDRDVFADALSEAGIETGVHYHPAAHRHAATRSLRSAAGDFPVADDWARRELSLPMFPALGEDEIERVAEACSAALGA